MEHDEQAERLEKEGDAMQEASEELGEKIDKARSGWESKKSDTQAPGAASAEAAGAHNLESEDPATGEQKGEERKKERDEALRSDAERELAEEEQGPAG
jgi:hypothetical protein